jgi:UDP-glucose 4-epimerase
MAGVDAVLHTATLRADLGWRPRYDFRHALELLRAGREPRSALATSVGAKGYHPGTTGPSTTR